MRTAAAPRLAELYLDTIDEPLEEPLFLYSTQAYPSLRLMDIHYTWSIPLDGLQQFVKLNPTVEILVFNTGWTSLVEILDYLGQFGPRGSRTGEGSGDPRQLVWPNLKSLEIVVHGDFYPEDTQELMGSVGRYLRHSDGVKVRLNKEHYGWPGGSLEDDARALIEGYPSRFSYID